VADLVRPLAARGIDVAMEVDEGVARRLAEREQQVVYRVARECLRNIVRHAEAQNVRVALRRDPGVVDDAHPFVLHVDDDGRGFDAEAVATLDGHFGIRAMTDVATDAGAVLRVASSPGAGTRWVLALPEEEP
jgi:two-component system NarL family sensor kinase